MVFYIMLCEPHFHRFVAVVTTQAHRSQQTYTQGGSCPPAALEQLPSPQGTTASQEAELPFGRGSGTPGSGF